MFENRWLCCSTSRHWIFVLTLTVVVLAFGGLHASRLHAQEEGPIEGPLEGPVDGPAESNLGDDSKDDEPTWDTGIIGKVVDAKTGEGILEGPVVIVEIDQKVMTDFDGNFAVHLQPGVYTLRAYYDFYLPARLENIEVRAGEKTSVEIKLEAAEGGAFVEEVVVTGRADTQTEAAQLQARKKSTAVRDAVSAEEMSRSGDSSAASATRRVVAANVVGGQYLFVRGLGASYTSVFLNGAPLPQLDPYVGGVQLDLFPSSALSNIAILKSYSAELPGAFGGGTMLLESHGFPEEFELKLSVSMNGNSESTFRKSPNYTGGGLDFFGYDDGHRQLPTGAENTALVAADGRTLADVDTIARGFQDVAALDSSLVPPGFGLSASVGDQVSFGGRPKLGYFLAVDFGTKEQSRNTELSSVAIDDDGSVRKIDELTRRSHQRSAQLWAFGTANLELNDFHQLTFTTLYSHIGENYVGENIGFREERGRDDILREVRYSFSERSVSFNQLSGSHFFSKLKADWRLQTVWGEFDQPDTVDYLYQKSEDGELWVDRNPGDGQRLFLNNEQLDIGGGVDFEMPFDSFVVRAGGTFNFGTRDYTMRRFEYNRSRRAPAESFELPPEELFSSSNSGNAWRLSETTAASDSYRATEDLFALYGSAEVEPFEWLVLSAGLRVEAFRQELKARNPYSDQVGETKAFRSDFDLLPVGSAIVRLRDDLQVRGSYGKTVVRPRAIEISGSVIPDFVRRRTAFGDPSVKSTDIHHFDLRWEWFVGPTEVVALSVFAKFFENPIEFVMLDTNRTVAYQNVEKATNYGAEAEARFDLKRLWKPLEGFSSGGNLTLVESRVELSEVQARNATSKIRPLKDQVPWMVNLSLGYAPEDGPLSLHLYYNVFGKRLTTPGVNGLPDTYQDPFHSLDFLFSYDFGSGLKLKGSVKNLLNSKVSLKQGGVVTRAYRNGVAGSVKLEWDY